MSVDMLQILARSEKSMELARHGSLWGCCDIESTQWFPIHYVHSVFPGVGKILTSCGIFLVSLKFWKGLDPPIYMSQPLFRMDYIILFMHSWTHLGTKGGMPYFVFVIHIVMIVFPSFHIFCIAYFGRKGVSPSSRDDFHAYEFIVLGFEGNQQFWLK